MARRFSIDVLGGAGSEVCVVARGDLDVSAAGEFRTAVTEHAESDQRVVVDLRPLDFIDSTGLHALIAAHRLLDERLVIMAEGTSLRLLQVTGLDAVLPLAGARPV